MNKKTKQAVIVLIITILLLGCGSLGIVGAEKYEENHNASSVSQESREQASNSDSSHSETQDDNAQESTDSKSNDADNSNGKNTNLSSSNKTGSGASDKQGNSASSSGSGSSSGSSSNSGSGSSGNATAKPSQKPQQGTNTDNKKTYNCTVTIDCSVVLNNMDNLTDGKEAYVPSSGYILKDYSLTAKHGESVYSLLKRACDENNIPLNATDSGFGKYVYGINNLDQKDCGSESGWKYSVNGVYPGRSCDAEKIKSNTKIVWKYVIHVNDT